jgi:hypothetical protein
MKRNTFIILLTLLLQIVVTLFAKLNDIMWLQAGISVFVPAFFMSMLILTVFNENVSDWFDTKINFKNLWKITKTQ